MAPPSMRQLKIVIYLFAAFLAVSKAAAQQPSLFEIVGSGVTVRETDGQARITVQRSGDLAAGAQVEIRSVDGTAHAGIDYTALSQTLAFAADEALQTVEIPLIRTRTSDGARAFSVELREVPGAGSVGANASAVITVRDVDGWSDPAFVAPEYSGNGNVTAIAALSDGTLLVADADLGLILRKRDGTRDLSFTPPASLPIYFFALCEQPDGRILAAGFQQGYVASPGDAPRDVGRIVRLLRDGSLDSTFSTWLVADYAIDRISLLPDGKIVICGAFSSISEVPRRGLARLTANGGVDFGLAPSFGTVYQAAGLPDGKVLAATESGLLRFLPSGGLDPDFQSTSDIVFSFAIDGVGRIIASGESQATPPAPLYFVTRYTANGAPDPSFHEPANLKGRATDLHVLPDGRILLSGLFRGEYDGIACDSIVRLLPDGEADPDFLARSNPGSLPLHMAVASDGEAYLGGGALEFDGQAATGLVRVHVGLKGSYVRFEAAALEIPEEPTRSAAVRIFRLGESDQAISVPYSGSGTASPAFSGELSFAPGQQVAQLSLAITDDADFEANESFTLALGAPTGGAQLGSPSTMQVRVANVDLPDFGVVQFEAAAVTVDEDAGSVVLKVQRTGAAPQADGVNVQVSYRTAAHTAVPYLDYTPVSGVHYFHTSPETETVTIPLTQNFFQELPRKFNVELSGPSGALRLGTNRVCTVTIADHDTGTAADLRGSYSGAIFDETDAGRGSFLFTLSAGGAASGAIILDGRRVPFQGLLNERTGAVETVADLGAGPVFIAFSFDFTGGSNSVSALVGTPAKALAFYGARAVDPKLGPLFATGRYTLLLEAKPAQNRPLIGSGFATIKVTPSGAVQWAGKLGDGTPLSFGAPLSRDSNLYRHFRYAGGKGIFTCFLGFAIGGARDCTGGAYWRRPAANAILAANAAVGLSLTGSSFTPGETPWSSARLTYSAADPQRPAAISGALSSSYSLQPGGATPPGFSFSVNPFTGLLTGRFPHPASRQPLLLQGIVLRDENRGAGFYKAPGDYSFGLELF